MASEETLKYCKRFIRTRVDLHILLIPKNTKRYGNCKSDCGGQEREGERKVIEMNLMDMIQTQVGPTT